MTEGNEDTTVVSKDGSSSCVAKEQGCVAEGHGECEKPTDCKPVADSDAMIDRTQEGCDARANNPPVVELVASSRDVQDDTSTFSSSLSKEDRLRFGLDEAAISQKSLGFGERFEETLSVLERLGLLSASDAVQFIGDGGDRIDEAPWQRGFEEADNFAPQGFAGNLIAHGFAPAVFSSDDTFVSMANLGVLGDRQLADIREEEHRLRMLSRN
eukprot:TRINITY_DN63490_c0_g1_i1.p1 TRINITY_DN63490_c0_g1~~TRINITY_DN63490_c0_g1_i1.p1  ORF type:complete len:213 (-),score=48.21 TRINITY_DN63490_c0_g1_i1:95-733(-)